MYIHISIHIYIYIYYIYLYIVNWVHSKQVQGGIKNISNHQPNLCEARLLPVGGMQRQTDPSNNLFTWRSWVITV